MQSLYIGGGFADARSVPVEIAVFQHLLGKGHVLWTVLPCQNLVEKLRPSDRLLARIVPVEIDPPLIDRCDQFVGFPFADRLWRSPEIGPALFELNECMRMKPLHFGAIARAEVACPYRVIQFEY